MFKLFSTLLVLGLASEQVEGESEVCAEGVTDLPFCVGFNCADLAVEIACPNMCRTCDSYLAANETAVDEYINATLRTSTTSTSTFLSVTTATTTSATSQTVTATSTTRTPLRPTNCGELTDMLACGGYASDCNTIIVQLACAFTCAGCTTTSTTTATTSSTTTIAPTPIPSSAPSATPTSTPSAAPSASPSAAPSSAPSAPTAPPPICIPGAAPCIVRSFDAGFGDCTTYAFGMENHNFCNSDVADAVFAYQVCAECGTCSPDGCTDLTSATPTSVSPSDSLPPTPALTVSPVLPDTTTTSPSASPSSSPSAAPSSKPTTNSMDDGLDHVSQAPSVESQDETTTEAPLTAPTSAPAAIQETSTSASTLTQAPIAQSVDQTTTSTTAASRETSMAPSGAPSAVYTTTSTETSDIDTSANGSANGDTSTGNTTTIIIIVIALVVVISATCAAVLVVVRRKKLQQRRRANEPFEWPGHPRSQPTIENKDFTLHSSKRSRASHATVPLAAYAGGSAPIAPTATPVHYFGPSRQDISGESTTDFETTPGKAAQVETAAPVSDDALARVLSPVRQLFFHGAREDNSSPACEL